MTEPPIPGHGEADATLFVESFATQQLLPSWLAKEAQTWAFVLDFTDRLEARLEKFLDDFFNAGLDDDAPYEYAPIPGSRYGLLTVSHCTPRASTGRSIRPVDSWDDLDHDDIFLSFAVLRRHRSEGQLTGGFDIVWVQPFMCSNSSTVVFSAREVWGCDMTYVETFKSQWKRDPTLAEINVEYLGPRKFAPQSRVERLPFLRVEAHGEREPAGDPETAKQTVEAVLESNQDLRGFFDILAMSGLVELASPSDSAPSAELVGGEIGFDLNYLKQIRDAFDLDRALYRAIIETRSLYDEMTEFRFLEETRVVVEFTQTVTMEEFLEDIVGVPARTGFASPSGGHDRRGRRRREASAKRIRIPAALAFTFKSNIKFDVLGTVYTYGPKYRPASTPAPTG